MYTCLTNGGIPMNLKHLTDQALLIDTELAVKTKKKATIVVLYHLQSRPPAPLCGS